MLVMPKVNMVMLISMVMVMTVLLVQLCIFEAEHLDRAA
jgi:hypothetical protein